VQCGHGLAREDLVVGAGATETEGEVLGGVVHGRRRDQEAMVDARQQQGVSIAIRSRRGG